MKTEERLSLSHSKSRGRDRPKKWRFAVVLRSTLYGRKIRYDDKDDVRIETIQKI